MKTSEFFKGERGWKKKIRLLEALCNSVVSVCAKFEECFANFVEGVRFLMKAFFSLPQCCRFLGHSCQNWDINLKFEIRGCLPYYIYMAMLKVHVDKAVYLYIDFKRGRGNSQTDALSNTLYYTTYLKILIAVYLVPYNFFILWALIWLMIINYIFSFL